MEPVALTSDQTTPDLPPPTAARWRALAQIAACSGVPTQLLIAQLLALVRVDRGQSEAQPGLVLVLGRGLVARHLVAAGHGADLGRDLVDADARARSQGQDATSV